MNCKKKRICHYGSFLTINRTIFRAKLRVKISIEKEKSLSQQIKRVFNRYLKSTIGVLVRCVFDRLNSGVFRSRSVPPQSMEIRPTNNNHIQWRESSVIVDGRFDATRLTRRIFVWILIDIWPYVFEIDRKKKKKTPNWRRKMLSITRSNYFGLLLKNKIICFFFFLYRWTSIFVFSINNFNDIRAEIKIKKRTSVLKRQWIYF